MECKERRYMMNYDEMTNYLLNIPRFVRKTSQENLRGFLRLLGNPHNQIPAIHVAGTNGKGSTCAFLSSILQQAGCRVGLFTSPHLVKINERFRMNETMISNSDMISIFDRVKHAIDEGVQMGLVHPGFFEYLFLMAACWYEEQQPDYVIYETGLGGRLDATNVLQPCLTVLTAIGLDHMQYLGNTLEEIAGEKAGILKTGIPCIYMKQQDITEAVIRYRGEDLQVPLIPVEKEKITIDEIREQTIDFSYVNRYDRKYSHIRHPFRYQIRKTALYQTENAALAIEAGYYLLWNFIKTKPAPQIPDRQLGKSQTVEEDGSGMDYDVIRTAVHQGVRQMTWQGRMEELEPGIYVDGAHNEPAIQAFCDTITRMYRDKKIILLFAVAADKRYNEMIRILCEAVSYERIIITTIDGERKTPVEQVREQFGQYTRCPILIEPDNYKALKTARTYLRPDNQVFCVGSLYLVGSLEAKKEDEP